MKLGHVRPVTLGLALVALLGMLALDVTLAQNPPGGSGQGGGEPPRVRRARPEGQDGPARGEGGQRGSVEGAMKGMNRAMKQLHASIADASKKDENLRLVNDMQRNCVVAKGLPVPDDVFKNAPDDAAKAKTREAIRRDLISVLRKLIEVEQSLLDGKTDAAKSTLDEVQKMREDAHKRLGIKDDDDE